MPLTTDYGRFSVEPLTPRFGAEVSGVAMNRLDDDLVALLRQAWLDWKVLFFRDQPISVEEHIAFGRAFGALEIHPFLPDNGHREIVVLDSAGDAPYKANSWHTDVTFRPCPPLGSVLRGRIIPAVGGDTCWADMERAYDRLDDALKVRIDGLTATHTLRQSFGPLMSQADRERALADNPDQHHPLVRVHPETGRRSLFACTAFTARIDGLPAEESRRLLRLVYAQAKVPEYQLRFRWRPDSFAMWDNRCTQHYGIVDYEGRRRMERVTLAGDRPLGVDAARA